MILQFALGILAGTIGSDAAAPTVPIVAGDMIMIARPSPAVCDGPKGREIGRSKWIAQCLHAIEVNSKWLRTTEGWIAFEDAVRLGDAIDYFSREIERAPSAFAYASRAAVWRSLNEDQKALDDAEQAVKADPQFAIGYCVRGTTRRRLREPIMALADFDHALRIEPQLARAFRERAHLHFEQKSQEIAIADINRAIELDPLNVLNLGTRAGIMYIAKNYDRAVRDFDEALRRDPFMSLEDGLIMSLTERASTRATSQDFQGAIADLDLAERRRPVIANAGFLLKRGMYHLFAGDARGAIADRRRGVALAPEVPETHSCLAEALLCGGDARGALRELNRAVELGDQSAATFLERGKTRAVFGDHIGAIADITKAIELNPNCRGALAERAAELLRTGDLDAAFNDCDAALRLGQGANTTRAQILIRWKRFEEARDECGTAILLQQDPKNARQLRGIALAALGEHALAVNDFSQAITLAEQDRRNANAGRTPGTIPIAFAKVFEPNGPGMSRAELAEIYTARARSLEAMGRTVDAAHDREVAKQLANSPKR